MQKKVLKVVLFLLIVAVVFPAALASAHQPRVTESRQTEVLNPEVSKAYYGKLSGEADVYTINAAAPFDLYVGVLVPDIDGQKKDVSATIWKDGVQIANLDAATFTWKKFFEPFGHDSYFEGPEYKARAEAGAYEIRVSSPGNDSKYSLAVGEIEKFDFKETLNAITLIPQLKKNFFDKSPIDFILSPFGWGLIVIMYILAIVAGWLYRFILKRMSKGGVGGVGKNIGKRDRLLRFAIGVVLLLLAITTTWNPLLFFFSGFAIFEALFSWCAVYQIMRKNTCPV